MVGQDMADSLRRFAGQLLPDTFDPSRRIHLIHPNYIPQHVLLASLINSDLIYVRFHGKQLTDDDLQAQLETAISAQTESKSRDLNAIENLILDECDRALKPELDSFLKRLIDQFLGKLFLLSRYVPTSVLQDDSVRGITQIIPSDEAVMLWDYAQRNESSGALLEVRALGDGRVQLNGELVEDWDGVLPRALFFYLVDRGMVTRNEIFETFWPTLTNREATNVFHVTKRKISEVLGTDLTVYWSGFYHISPRIHLSYDAALFTQKIHDSAVMPF